MRLLICAGGTGGGVNPALAVLQASEFADNPASVLWIGSVDGMEVDLVSRAGVPFTAVPAGQVHGISPQRLPANLWQLSRGVVAAYKALRRFKPDVIFFTGGYVAIPIALASRLPGARRSRILLYIPDIEPGWALKILARFADHIAVTTEGSKPFLPQKTPVTVTGYPVRCSLKTWERHEARQKLGLDPELPVLFVTGGSRGAQSINRALIQALPGLLPEMQVLHVSGNLDWVEVQAARDDLFSYGLSDELVARYHAFPFLHEEMGAALAAADLAVSRAGASTIGELPLFGLPAILVPYPYAWRYQKVNAGYLIKRGAAVLLKDEDLMGNLASQVRSLLSDAHRLSAMSQAMRSLARPSAAQVIASLASELAAASAGKRM